ncbi:hypothetical protein ABFS83_12G029400 [Erythranthe nasuta]
MAETNGSPLLHSLHAALDPKSLILSQFADSNHNPHLLQLTTESFIMERGPRFKEYSDLREKRLRMKNSTSEQQTPEKEKDQKVHSRSILTPPRKQVKLSSNFTTPPRRPKPPSVLTQSVPDFSSALRKENRRPAAPLPPVAERSPAASGRNYGKVVGGGSKSTNTAAEKRSGGGGGGLMARKSYASMEEIKGLAAAAGNAINGENKGLLKSSRGIGKTVLGYRQFY